MPAWRDAGPDVRAAVCVEIVDRINARSHEMAHAVMHTSGQPFVMSFQAGGPHAQDRALEAVVAALEEQHRIPSSVTWEKPAKGDPIRMQKDYRVVPRGLALVIGCNTFPTWNAYPGIFASLATGNPVIVKPHPRAVLPLAITVAVARDVLAEAGFERALVQLAPEDDGGTLAKDLALDPAVKIIDYTGGPGFGRWLETEAGAQGKLVYTEKAGLNTVVVDSTDDLKGLLGNLASTEAPDDTTVVFKLKSPNDQIWPLVLSSPVGPIVDEEVFPADKVLADADIVSLAANWGGIATDDKVTYGTEAGLFSEAGIPTVVCGPGDIAQAHAPDEFIELEQIAACESFIDALISDLTKN